MKKIISLLLALLLTFSLVACGDSETGAESTAGTAPQMSELDFSEVDASYFSETSEVTDYVKLSVSYTNLYGVRTSGDIIIRLFANVAPLTVQNFKNMVKRGIYNNSTFHRVIEDFMIQGGGSDETLEPIKGEFTSNGITNNLRHLRGVVSMARTNEPDSATSEFFIMHKDTAALDGKYASFGYVVSGMDTVDGIATIQTQYNGSGEFSIPTHVVIITKATFVQKSSTPIEKPTQTPISMDDLDFSAIDIANVTETINVTDLVKLTVSYTDAHGNDQTGDIVIRLFSDVAPVTVQNFQKLVNQGSYNGTVFHRVYKNFMIQGGELATDTETIKGEFTSNGFVNNLKHIRGVISMARTYIPDSATSQFFIMHQDTASLDGNYASFGYVVYGMDTVDGIANTDVKANPAMNGEVSAPINPVTIVNACFVTTK